jgi:hypothetical protein
MRETKMIENTMDNQEKMFFLTRTDGVEITSIEDVFNCGNQALYDPQRPDLEYDRFGRNYTDRQFVELCMTIWFLSLQEIIVFKFLSCKKINGQYIIHLELADETLEMELNEMMALFEERAKKQLVYRSRLKKPIFFSCPIRQRTLYSPP